jgi:phenylacetate-coenzyme A ligase PaaK-like adenylate-forming protein
VKRQWNHKIFNVTGPGFEAMAMELFAFQYENNPIYKAYTDAIGVKPAAVKSLGQIPFLPIRFFKSHSIQSGQFEPQAIFESSGTTGTTSSRHFVKEIELYRESFLKGFGLFYGNPADYCIIGLLPSYLERQHSSLVYMANELISQSSHTSSGFYLYELEKLATVIKELEGKQQRVLLIGVTYALLDFAEQFPMPLQHTIIMETGGMKGRREELIRQEVHDQLKIAFHLPQIHSEYGMTELLSQAYSNRNGIFQSPPWLKVLVRDDEDPLTIKTAETGETISGAINIIDLANIYSCSFIATDDAGRVFPDDSFEVIGRLDGSDLRGCSLLYF